MSNLKCPFCQQELFYTYQQDGIVPNPNKGKVDGVFCDNCKMYGNETIWERLDRTRKALDVAVDVLKEIDELLSSNKFDVKEVPLLNITQTKISMLLKCINIEQITALEQKD